MKSSGKVVAMALLFAMAIGGLTMLGGKGPSESELERVYQLAMDPRMQNVAELQWASALLRSHGRIGQADNVDTKWQAIRAAPPSAEAPHGFTPGHHYSARVQLSGLEAMFASANDVEKAAEEKLGMPVAAEPLGAGAYLLSGVWQGAPAPYPVPLPERVVWIRDDTSGETIQ